MKEETKSKVKSWIKKNWGYVVVGASVVGMAALVAISSGSSDNSLIDPYLIDRATDDWMDILKVPYQNGKITVRQALNLTDYYEWLICHIQIERGCCLNSDTEIDSFNVYEDLFPEKAESILSAWD